MSRIKHESQWNHEGLNCKVSIAIDAPEIERLMSKKSEDFFKKSAGGPKGFRGQKTNARAKAVFVARYEHALLAELADELVQNLTQEILEEAKVVPVMRPQVKLISEALKRHAPFAYEVSFERYPVIPAYTSEHLVVPCLEAEVSDEDVDNALKALEKRAVEWVEVDRPAMPNDRISFEYEVHEGEAAHACKHEGNIELDATLPESMAALLLTRVKGDTVTIDDVTPWMPYIQQGGHHHHAENVQSIRLHVKRVSESKPKAFDSTVWSSVGYRAEDLDALKIELKEELELQARAMAEHINLNAFKPMLLELVDFELPKGPIEDELKRLNGIEKSQMPEGVDLEKLACENVKLSLILRDCLERERISVDRARVFQFVRSQAPMSGYFRDFYANYMLQDERNFDYWAMQVLEQQLVEHVLNQAKKEIEKVSFEDLKEKMKGE